MRAASLLLALAIILIGAGGCGGSHRTSTPAELGLEREDLLAVAHSLQAVEGPVTNEVAAAKSAWPLIANGLPTHMPASVMPAVSAAAAAAAAVKQPQLFGEGPAAALTGPASALAGDFRTFDGLSRRGWQLIGAAIRQIEQGSPAGARFARENVGLDVESVYDGHFTLAQVGKQLAAAYKTLGGPAGFGRTLSQAEVDALANFYSEASDRLHPHVGLRFGS